MRHFDPADEATIQRLLVGAFVRDSRASGHAALIILVLGRPVIRTAETLLDFGVKLSRLGLIDAVPVWRECGPQSRC